MFFRLFSIRKSLALLSLLALFSPALSFAQEVIISDAEPNAVAATSTEPTEIIVQYKGSDGISVVDAVPSIPIDTIVADLNADPAVEHAELGARVAIIQQVTPQKLVAIAHQRLDARIAAGQDDRAVRG